MKTQSSCLLLLIVYLCLQLDQTLSFKDKDISPDFTSELYSYSNKYKGFVLQRRPSTNLTKIVIKAVTKLQEYMKNGNDNLSIPIMEPFLFNQTLYNISSRGEIIRLNGQVNGTIVGLSDFSIESCVTVLAGLWASVTLVFPKIKASGTYSANGLIADVLPFTGEGHYDITLTNVTANFQPQCNDNATNVLLKQFKVNYSIGDSQMNLEGLMGPLSGIMKQFIQDAEEAIISRTMAWVETVLENSAKDFSAETIFKSGISPGKFIQYLQNF